MSYTPAGPLTAEMDAILVRLPGRADSFIRNMNENPVPVCRTFARPLIVALAEVKTGPVLEPGRVESDAGVSVPGRNVAGLVFALAAPNEVAALPSSSGQ